jgi:formate/nitrite transporter FocA (FNT family)
MRLWAIVLCANLAGTGAFAFAIARLDPFAPSVRHALDTILK